MISKTIDKTLMYLVSILLIDISIRHIIEVNFVDTKRDFETLSKHLLDHSLFYYENLSYFILLFLIMSFIIQKFTHKNIEEIMMLGSKLYFLVILPPLLDRFVFNHLSYTQPFLENGYTYGTLNNYLNNIITTSFGTGDTSYGISILVVMGMLGAGIYTFIQTKSIIKFFVIMIIMDIVIITLSTPELLLKIGVSYYNNELLLMWYYLPISVMLLIYSYSFKFDTLYKTIFKHHLYSIIIINILYWITEFIQVCKETQCDDEYNYIYSIPLLYILFIMNKYYHLIQNKSIKHLFYGMSIYYCFGYFLIG